MVPTTVLQALQTQPLKESSADPSVAGLIAAINAMHDLLMQYRYVVQHVQQVRYWHVPCRIAVLAAAPHALPSIMYSKCATVSVLLDESRTGLQPNKTLAPQILMHMMTSDLTPGPTATNA